MNLHMCHSTRRPHRETSARLRDLSSRSSSGFRVSESPSSFFSFDRCVARRHFSGNFVCTYNIQFKTFPLTKEVDFEFDEIAATLPFQFTASSYKQSEMSGKHWITEPNGYLDPVIDKSGEGAKPSKTVIQVFQDTVSKHGDRSALALKRKPEVYYLVSLFDAVTRTGKRHQQVALLNVRQFDR